MCQGRPPSWRYALVCAVVLMLIVGRRCSFARVSCVAVFPYTDPAGSIRDSAETDPHHHPLIYCPSPPYPAFQCQTCNRNARGPRYRCVSGNHSECRAIDVCVRCVPSHYFSTGIEAEHPDAELAWFRRLSLLKPLVDFLLASTKPITKKWRQRLITVCLSCCLSVLLCFTQPHVMPHNTQIGKSGLLPTDYSSEAELTSVFLSARLFTAAADAESVSLCNTRDDKGTDRLEKVCIVRLSFVMCVCICVSHLCL